jgi:WS/DGAT/MGAT family acyltransferase
MAGLSLLDLGFFVAESKASPKHVGGLLILTRPTGAAANWVRKLHAEMLTHKEVKPPFNRVIRLSLSALPHWQEISDVDLKQHVFYHRMEKGDGDRKSLYRLVAKLHEPMLDRSRPLWEVHVIDGLDDGRFALYQKMHHACADGITMVRWTTEALSTSADDPRLMPLWTRPGARSGGSRRAEQDLFLKLLKGALGLGRHALGAGRLGAMLFLESVTLTRNAIALPFVSTARTPLTGTVTKGRQFASAEVPMARVNALRERTRSTLNHVALTCIDGALRRYLSDLAIELDRPITIQMPVSLRKDGEKGSGNRIGIIQVELSPPTDDPYVRLRNIGFSLRAVRNMVDRVAPEAIQSYTVVVGLVAQIAEMMNLSDVAPPTGNTLVSNVPGPRDYLYLQGARMEEMHPISTLPASNLVNITLFSYAGRLFFGLIATDRLPELGRLAKYVAQAFDELEVAVLDVHRPAERVAHSETEKPLVDAEKHAQEAPPRLRRQRGRRKAKSPAVPAPLARGANGAKKPRTQRRA